MDKALFYADPRGFIGRPCRSAHLGDGLLPENQSGAVAPGRCGHGAFGGPTMKKDQTMLDDLRNGALANLPVAASVAA
jgi:hypothetical protein